LLNTLGWCFAELGDAQRARGYNERAATLAREIGDPEILANADINLALNHLAAAAVEPALANIEALEAKLAQPSDPWMQWRYGLHVRHARAELDLVRGAPERALIAADDELAGARRFHAPRLEARAALGRAAALLALDARDEVEATLQDVVTIGGRIGYRRALWEAQRLSALLARRRGDTQAAASYTAQARATAARAAESLADTDLKRMLMAAAVRE
jgi:hypothetical protein